MFETLGKYTRALIPSLPLLQGLTFLALAVPLAAAVPTCKFSGLDPMNQNKLVFLIQDADNGLLSITHTEVNFVVTVAPFTVGTTAPVVVTAQLIVIATASVNLDIRDIAGERRKCEFDHFPNSKALVKILFQKPPVPMAAPDSIIAALRGPATVMVDLSSLADLSSEAAGGAPGVPNGREEVSTELVQLNLAGSHPLVGPILLKLRDPLLRPFARSTGLIEEIFNALLGTLDLAPFVAANTCPGGCQANSFFKVFFQIEIPVFGLILHNEIGLRIASVINKKPPDTEYIHDFRITGPVPLVDEALVLWATLIGASHITRGPQIVNGLLTYRQDAGFWTWGGQGVPRYPIKATFKNVSGLSIIDPFFRIAILDGEGCPCFVEGVGVVGNTVKILTDNGGLLLPGRTFSYTDPAALPALPLLADPTLVVRPARVKPFRFFVDVWGTISVDP